MWWSPRARLGYALSRFKNSQDFKHGPLRKTNSPCPSARVGQRVGKISLAVTTQTCQPTSSLVVAPAGLPYISLVEASRSRVGGEEAARSEPSILSSMDTAGVGGAWVHFLALSCRGGCVAFRGKEISILHPLFVKEVGG